MNAQNQKAPPSSEQRPALRGQRRELDWRQYCFVLWRRKWWVLVPVFLLTGMSVVAAILFIRPVFEVSASIQVLPSRLEGSMREASSGASNPVDYRELQKKILSTPYLLLLIQRLELRKDALANEAARSKHEKATWLPYEQVLEQVLLETLRDNLSVQINPGAQLFQITARSASPRMAYRLVNSLADIFIEKSQKDELRDMRAAREISNAQLEIYKQNLQDTERKLQDLERRRSAQKVQAIRIDATSATQLRQFMRTSENAIAERQRRLADLQHQLHLSDIVLLWERDARLQQVKAKIEATLNEFKKSTIAKGLRTDFELALDNEMNVLRQEYNLYLQEIIPQAYATLAEELHGVMIEYQMGQIDIYIFRTRAQAAEDVLRRNDQRSTFAPADEIEWQRLQTELQQNRHNYELLLEQSRGAQIEEALQNSSGAFKYNVIETTTLPKQSVGGNKKAFILGSFGVSVMLGLSLVVVLELSDQSIRDVQEVEQMLAAPVWGIVPKMSVSFQVWQQSLEQMYRDAIRSEISPTTRATSTAKPAPSSTVGRATGTVQYPDVERLKTANAAASAIENDSPRRAYRTRNVTATSLGVRPAAAPDQLPTFDPIPRKTFTPKTASTAQTPARKPAQELPAFNNGVQQAPGEVSPDEQDQWIV